MVFLEIEVLSINNPLLTKKQLLEQIAFRVRRTHQVEPIWNYNTETPKIRFQYTSKEHLEQCYKRDIFLFEKIVEFLNSGILTKEDLHQMNLKRKLELPLIPVEITDGEQPLYLILKYTTDYKDPLRNNYRITLKVAEYLDYNVEVEEIADGFLLFFKNPEDFEANQIDKASMKEMVQFLKEKKVMTPELTKIIKMIYEEVNINN